MRIPKGSYDEIREPDLRPCCLGVGRWAAQHEHGTGELNVCRAVGEERTFPCTLNRQVVRSHAQLLALTQPRLNKAGPKPTPNLVRNCGKSLAQAAFPCRVIEGWLAKDARAFFRARAALGAANELAKARGRKLTLAEAQAVVSRISGMEAEKKQRRRVENKNDVDQPNTQAVRPRQRAETIMSRQRERQQQLRNKRFAPATASRAGQRAVSDWDQVIGPSRRAEKAFPTPVASEGQRTAPQLSFLEKAVQFGMGDIAISATLSDGSRVISRSGDRIVTRDQWGRYHILKNDDSLIRRQGDHVAIKTFEDGSTRNTITKRQGTKVISIRGPDGRMIRRFSINPNGLETLLFDDSYRGRPIAFGVLPKLRGVQQQAVNLGAQTLQRMLTPQLTADHQRRYGLRQVLEVAQVRGLAAAIEVPEVQFAHRAAVIGERQARALEQVGIAMRRMIAQDPSSVFLIEVHTGGGNDASYKLALSDRRAESVGLAMVEYFQVPPENLVIQGYGNSELYRALRRNRRGDSSVIVRNLTGLLR